MMLCMDDRLSTLTPLVRERLASEVPAAVESVVAAVLDAAPAYAALFHHVEGDVIRGQIHIALLTYLKMAEPGARPLNASADTLDLVRPATEAAFELGRNEARFGRGTETLLTAFRVGARSTWHAFASTLTSSGVSSVDVADFAEQLFDFIDQLSAAAVAGHEFQAARDLRIRQTERDFLARDLLHGREPGSERLSRAEWMTPSTIAVVLATDVEIRRVRDQLPMAALIIAEDLPEPLAEVRGLGAALVPDLNDGTRQRLLARLSNARVVVGPVVDMDDTQRSFRWAAALWPNAPAMSNIGGAVDANQRVVDILLQAEPTVIAELRRQHLAPLDGLTPATRERLEETLRLWLDLRGRHDLVAAAMHVHPQTVRYRIGQLQELIGSALANPDHALGLRLALTRTTGSV